MRCHICDSIMENPTTDKDTGKYEPCSTCIQSVKELEYGEDTFFDFTDEDIEILTTDETIPLQLV